MLQKMIKIFLLTLLLPFTMSAQGTWGEKFFNASKDSVEKELGEPVSSYISQNNFHIYKYLPYDKTVFGFYPLEFNIAFGGKDSTVYYIKVTSNAMRYSIAEKEFYAGSATFKIHGFKLQINGNSSFILQNRRKNIGGEIKIGYNREHQNFYYEEALLDLDKIK